MLRRVVLVLPLLLTLLLSLLLTGAPAATAADTATTYAAQAHAATNKARAGAGHPTLGRDRCLLGFARSQARRMATAGELSHQDLSPVLAACGLRAAGENVAVGFSSGRKVVRGWLRSEGHRANIMSTAFRVEAIAAVRAADGDWYVAQVFGRNA